MGLFSSIGKAVGGFAKKAAAKRNQRRAAADRKRATAEMSSLEKTRQKVINPYDKYSNLSSLAKDLSGNLSNPYANMSVSTAAAEMKIEEADLALANTLDALMASGASAGGATALAQAALQSKKGVAASIEQQEAQNEKMRAGGEERLQQLELREGQRVQQVQIQEGRRMQEGEMMGRKYKFDAQEKRDVRKMNFLRGEYKTAKGREYGASMAKASAIGDIASGLGGIADSAFGNPFAAKTPPGAASPNPFTQMQTDFTSNVNAGKYNLDVGPFNTGIGGGQI